MNQKIFANMKHLPALLSVILLLAISSFGQTGPQREPSKPIRPFVVMTGQSLSDLERKLQPGNKVEEVIGGTGMQLRVAIQHDLSRPTAGAELHDASDDVYYVLEGTATLTLGGRLDAPHQETPGEWRSERITGGQTFQLAKGDLIVVPRGTPHQRTGKDFSMILIKIYADPLPPPKPAATPTPASTPTPAATPTPPKARTPAKP